MRQFKDKISSQRSANFFKNKDEKKHNTSSNYSIASLSPNSSDENEVRQEETGDKRRSRNRIKNRNQNNQNYRGSQGNQGNRSPNHSLNSSSRKIAKALPQKAQFLALDCEMVGVGPLGQKSSVACVTVLDWHGGLLFNSHIKQTEPVTDYRTFVSGITEKNLETATMTLEKCREIISQLIYNRILVGHALENDLALLDIAHPWWMTRDSATYEPFMRTRHDGFLWPRKLKELAIEKLKKEIQIAGRPHSSYEDALAALDLYKSVRVEWEGNMKSKIQNVNSLHYPLLYSNYKEQMERDYIRLAREQQQYFIRNPLLQRIQ